MRTAVEDPTREAGTLDDEAGASTGETEATQQDANNAPVDSLRVAPAEGITLSASVGRSTPLRTEFVVGNPGKGEVEWRVSCDAKWLRLTRTSGTSRNRARNKMIIAVEPEALASLSPGVHVAELRFDNLTNGEGSTTRRVVLILAGDKGLAVELAESGGFELRNESANTIAWRARAMAPWFAAEPRGGDLEPGATIPVRLSIDAARLPNRTDALRTAVAFVNTTDGVGSTSRSVVLAPDSDRLAHSASTDAETDVHRRKTLSQFGITWTFDRDYEVGRFANGDWWVVGPVLILGIDPASTVVGKRTKNGSMVNPSPRRGMKQGYDNAMYGKYASRDSYSPGLNVALDASSRKPIFLTPDRSLVSTVSQEAGNARPQILTAAVLTVLDAPAPHGSFRPAYSLEHKKILFNESQLDYGLLGNLEHVSSTPNPAKIERSVRRPWIDHVPGWTARYTHPADNMPEYGRGMADAIGTASLLLNLDYTTEQKRDLLVSFVQLGIDFYGITQSGGNNNWPPKAGHMSGRKWPILFAGIMLGDPDMSAIGFDSSIAFGEDGQTFYVEETSPGVYNNGNGGYTAAHVGLAEWGTAHSVFPDLDDANWLGDPYRLCCTANSWWGQILSARIMGAQSLWNHDELFDYQDRYLDENVSRGITDWRLSWTRFPIEMWNAHRAKY